MNNQENQVEIDVFAMLKSYGNASFRSFWSLLSLPLQHLATVPF